MCVSVCIYARLGWFLECEVLYVSGCVLCCCLCLCDVVGDWLVVGPVICTGPLFAGVFAKGGNLMHDCGRLAGWPAVGL